MKRKLLVNFIAVMIFSGTVLQATDSIFILENGTTEEIIETIYHMGYAGSIRGFWYFVKYLDYLPNGNESFDSIKMREASAEALGRIEYEPAVEYLITRYGKEKQIKVKIKIIFALSFYKNDKAIPVIKEALSSSDSNLRFEALTTASKYENTEFDVYFKTAYTESKDILAKCSAAYGLYLLNNEKQYLDFLISALKEKSPETRYWAAHYLGLIGEVSAMPYIINALKIENKYWVRNEMELAVSSLSEREREIEKSNRDAQYDFLIR